MTDYVWYPVTGDGQTQATQFVWNTGQINWNTSADWVQGTTLVFQNPGLSPGAVPGSGSGTGAGASQGPGKDNVGLVAGDVIGEALQLYQPDPAKGDPYIGSHTFSVDVLVNSGTVDINNLLLSGFNQYAEGETPQLPTLDVEGATFKIEGSIANSQAVLFPTLSVPFIGTIGGLLTATGGGTIDIGSGGTVQVAGSVQANVVMNFNDGKSDLLDLAGVSANAPGAFAGTIANFAAGDTIFLPALGSPATYTPSFNDGTLTISNGSTTLAALPMSGTFSSTSFALQSANGGTDVVLSSGSGTGLLGNLTPAQQLELIYIAYFNRAADGPGDAYWGGQNVAAQAAGQSASLALTNIANSFAPQAETVALYPFLTPLVSGGTIDLSTPAAQTGLTAFVGSVYENLFNRAADQAGQSYWVDQITSGAVGLGAAALAIANGATASDAIEVQNKITVAQDFTTRTYSAGFGVSGALPASYIPEARSVLSGVDGTSLNDASVTAGEAATTAYLAATPVPTATVAASQGAGASSAADPAIITIAGSNQVIDPGAGNQTIQFLPGASADTLVLSANAVEFDIGVRSGHRCAGRSRATGIGEHRSGRRGRIAGRLPDDRRSGRRRGGQLRSVGPWRGQRDRGPAGALRNRHGTGYAARARCHSGNLTDAARSLRADAGRRTVQGPRALFTVNARCPWLGREDSNLRMTESKSVALPLGDAPPGPVQAIR